MIYGYNYIYNYVILTSISGNYMKLWFTTVVKCNPP